MIDEAKEGSGTYLMFVQDFADLVMLRRSKDIDEEDCFVLLALTILPGLCRTCNRFAVVLKTRQRLYSFARAVGESRLLEHALINRAGCQGRVWVFLLGGW